MLDLSTAQLMRMLYPQGSTFYFGQNQVQPATAVDTPANAALGVTPGQTGGQDMMAPLASSATPGGMTAGMGVANVASGAISTIADAASKMALAEGQYNAVTSQEPVPGIPAPYTPILANLNVGDPSVIGKKKPLLQG